MRQKVQVCSEVNASQQVVRVLGPERIVQYRMQSFQMKEVDQDDWRMEQE